MNTLCNVMLLIATWCQVAFGEFEVVTDAGSTNLDTPDPKRAQGWSLSVMLTACSSAAPTHNVERPLAQVGAWQNHPSGAGAAALHNG
jgi:hypothetical protein